MYTRVLHDELIFPDERPVDQDTKSLIRGVSPLFLLLRRDRSPLTSFLISSSCKGILHFD